MGGGSPPPSSSLQHQLGLLQWHWILTSSANGIRFQGRRAWSPETAPPPDASSKTGVSSGLQTDGLKSKVSHKPFLGLD